MLENSSYALNTIYKLKYEKTENADNNNYNSNDNDNNNNMEKSRNNKKNISAYFLSEKKFLIINRFWSRVYIIVTGDEQLKNPNTEARYISTSFD